MSSDIGIDIKKTCDDLDAARAKIGELSRENIGLKTMLTESENRRAGIDKCITEAAAKIVSQELEIIRLKAANAELVQKYKALFNECSIDGMQEITDDEADEYCVGAPTVQEIERLKSAIASAEKQGDKS